MANLSEFNSANFAAEVLNATGPVLVDFSAAWCGPCKQLAPVVEEVARDYAPKGVKVGKVDIDESPDLAAQFGVMAVPTLLFFKGGQVRDQAMFSPKGKIAEKLDRLLKG